MSSPAYPAGYGPTQQALAQQALSQQLFAQQALAQSAGSSGLPQVSLHTVLVALRCWWHIVLPIGLLLAAGAATVVYYVTKPTYTASAWIQILPAMAMPGGTYGDNSQKFMANQSELMRSPPVLEPVIAMAVVRSAPELRDEEDPMLYLRNHLNVFPRGLSDYFSLEFKSQDPAKAAIIVNSVAESYLNLYKRHDSRVSQEKIDLLDLQAKEQASEVERLSRDVDRLTRQLGGAPLSRPQSSEQIQQDVFQQRLEAQLMDLEIESFTTYAELKAEEELIKKEEYLPPDDLVLPYVEKDARIANLNDQLAIKKAKRDEHKKVSKNLATNTVYQRLESEIAADEAQLKTLIDDVTKEVKAGMERMGRLKRQADIEELNAKLVRLNGQVEMMKGRLVAKKVENTEIAGAAWELERAKRAEKRADKFHEALLAMIQSLKADLRAPERVKSFHVASVPTRPDEEIPMKRMLLAALAALLIPFGLAVGVEVLFGRVASRQQLEHAGKIAVVGEITSLPRRLRGHIQDGAQRRDVQLFEESINGLRTYLTLIEASRGRRVLAVTSSISREGKTSLAAQLAVSVANSTGKPTLLVDGDMRSPDIHRIFDVDVGPGLAEVLAGRIPVEEAIETEVSSRLHLLTAGRLTVSPHQLTGGGEFAATIEKLKGMYESIIIDTPPILPASEALLMAGAADATILCVRRDYSRVDQVSESVQRLVASGVKVAGAVLNGVPIQHYVYRYGSYYYTKARPEDAPSVEDDESLTAG